MIGPPAAARCFTDRPGVALFGSVAVALIVVWASIALSYETDWPVGFFVGGFSAASYGLGHAYAAWRTSPSGARRARLRARHGLSRSNMG